MSSETTAKVTIGEIDTKPVYDPMQNISGMTTYTEFHLDCESGEAWISQEQRTNSTPMRWWHGHVLYCKIDGHPLESQLRTDLERYLPDIQTIVDGYASVWNGHNHVAQYSEAAQGAWEELRQFLEGYYAADHYEYYEIEDWLHPAMEGEITADTSDAEIAKHAEEWMLTDAHIAINGDLDDAIRYITGYRDTKRHEREAYG